MSDETSERAVGPTYQTQHFEARPYRDGSYILMYRKGHNHLASNKPIPPELANATVEIAEQAFHLGAAAMSSEMTAKFRPEALLHELCRELKVEEVPTDPKGR